jgi:hypothetical protein
MQILFTVFAENGLDLSEFMQAIASTPKLREAYLAAIRPLVTEYAKQYKQSFEEYVAEDSEPHLRLDGATYGGDLFRAGSLTRYELGLEFRVAYFADSFRCRLDIGYFEDYEPEGKIIYSDLPDAEQSDYELDEENNLVE